MTLLTVSSLTAWVGTALDWLAGVPLPIVELTMLFASEAELIAFVSSGVGDLPGSLEGTKVSRESKLWLCASLWVGMFVLRDCPIAIVAIALIATATRKFARIAHFLLVCAPDRTLMVPYFGAHLL